MWIVRFHKLQTKDYNKITRLIKKSWFTTRRIAPIIYGKSLVRHVIQKRSLRNVVGEFSISHIALHKFIHFIQDKKEYEKIFHVFLEARTILYIDNPRSFTQHDLDNSEEIYILTTEVLKSILQRDDGKA